MVSWRLIKLIVVDLDNTLCDTFHTITKRQWLHVADAFEGRGRLDIARILRKNPGKQSFTRTLHTLELTAVEGRFALKKYNENPVRALTLFPDALEFLKTPVPIVLLTRGEAGLQKKKIKHLGIEKFFKQIVIVDMLDCKKPAMQAILKRWKVKPSEALVVGDRIEEEIADAQALKIPSVLVRRPGLSVVSSRVKPDMSVRSLRTITRAIEKR